MVIDRIPFKQQDELAGVFHPAAHANRMTAIGCGEDSATTFIHYRSEGIFLAFLYGDFCTFQYHPKSPIWNPIAHLPIWPV